MQAPESMLTLMLVRVHEGGVGGETLLWYGIGRGGPKIRPELTRWDMKMYGKSDRVERRASSDERLDPGAVACQLYTWLTQSLCERHFSP